MAGAEHAPRTSKALFLFMFSSRHIVSTPSYFTSLLPRQRISYGGEEPELTNYSVLFLLVFSSRHIVSSAHSASSSSTRRPSQSLFAFFCGMDTIWFGATKSRRY